MRGRDLAFFRALVSTTLRHLGGLDALIEPRLSRRPGGRAGAAALALMRLGAAQILHLRVPDHAAVAETVAEAAPLGATRLTGLVNAILRGLAGDAAAGRLPADSPPALPAWMLERWTAFHGAPAAAAMAQAHLAEPPLDLTVREDLDDWTRRLGGITLGPSTVRLREAGPVPELPGFEAGGWWVQDVAASLPARLLEPVAGKRVIDLCAAPGGKTAQLAAAGAEVVAVESAPERATRLRANLQRLGLSVAVVEADALDWRPPAPGDAVLLDAPCGATGTMRRNPDIPWHRRPTDFAAMAPRQEALLEAALEMLAEGGVLVYAVCSLEPEEGPDVVRSVLARRPDVVRRPILSEELGLPEADRMVTEDGDLRTRPDFLASVGGMDGFYAARLVWAG